MYTLNLVFDFNDTDGRFTGDRGANPLLKSRNWLLLNIAEPANPNPPAFNPEVPANWTDLGEADTLLLTSAPDPGNICIRVLADPTAAGPFDPSTATLQLIVGFGAPAGARQRFASPFTTDGTAAGPTRSAFAFAPIRRNSGPVGAEVAWFFPLGKIQKRPVNPRLIHRYEFALGVIVTTPAVEIRNFGDDPEMDVGA